MSSVFDKLIKMRKNFGMFLVLAGIFMAYFVRNSTIANTTLQITLNLIPVLLIVSGIVALFLELQRKDLKVSNISDELESDLSKAISQLSKNYDILRKQTIHGFTMSGIFMSLGFIIILIGVTGEFFKLQTDTKTVTILSGVVVEFISGTALLLYRLNFRRLNETSDKLLSTWKLLTAFDKAKELSTEKRDDVIIDLIKILSQ